MGGTGSGRKPTKYTPQVGGKPREPTPETGDGRFLWKMIHQHCDWLGEIDTFAVQSAVNAYECHRVTQRLYQKEVHKENPNGQMIRNLQITALAASDTWLKYVKQLGLSPNARRDITPAGKDEDEHNPMTGFLEGEKVE